MPSIPVPITLICFILITGYELPHSRKALKEGYREKVCLSTGHVEKRHAGK
ncbi:hypothetical protein ACSAZL_16730 [Methanosarcina sp. T3]|uniref:hypothetical protein n=1 Tax=Methanosarcina sp. T3 TaxID=3439062 RepID=UPI003F87AA30